MDDFGQIQQDIIIEILSRLPVKSLLRFKCVCESWLSTITTSSFVYQHFNMALADCKKAQLLIKYYDVDSREDVFSLFTNDQLKAPTYLRLHTKPKGHFRVMGPCHGLLCLIDTSDELCLWNLATKEIKDIPDAPIPHDVEYPNIVLFGFGFDWKTRDYKVVKLLKKDCIEENNDFHIHVYTLSSNSWRKLDVVLLAHLYVDIYFYGNSAYNKGTYYWWAGTVIIGFDMSNEQFGVIDLPKIVFPLVEEREERDSYFTEYNGTLAVIYWLVNEKSETWFELWKMNGHGMTVTWTKQFSVGWLEVRLRPIGTFKSNRIPFVNKYEGYTIIPYDHETKSLQIPLPADSEIKIRGPTWETIAVFYTESLVSMGDG